MAEISENLQKKYDPQRMVEIERALEDFKLKQGEINIELNLKRTQVSQLRKDLDASNLENNVVKRELENARKKVEEYSSNLNLALKKCHDLEMQLREKVESSAELQLKNNLMGTENETLKHILMDAKTERNEIARKCEDLESKSEYFTAFQNELRKRDFYLRTLLTNLQSEVSRLENAQKSVLDLAKTTESAEKILVKTDALKEMYVSSQKINHALEKKLIKMTAKFQKLEELLQKPVAGTENKPETELIMSEWRKSQQFFKEEFEIKNEIISKLTERLNDEQNANVKLVLNDMEQNRVITELEEKLISFEKELKDIEVHTNIVGKDEEKAEGSVMASKKEIIQID